MLPRRRWAAYLLVPLLGVLPTLLSPGHIVGDGVDAFGTGWFYWWIRVCVTHLGNPGWTPLFFAPEGKDIFAHTGNNFIDALWSVPFQLLLGRWWSGPFTLLLLAGNAWSFEQLARALWPDPRDTVAATLAWMVNPYPMFELTAGRPTQAMLWWMPLAVLGLWRVCRGEGARAAFLLGAATALTGWTYWFAAYFLVFLMVPLAVWWGAWRRVPMLALAVGVCAALVLPMAVGMQHAWDAGLVPGVRSGGPKQANVDPDLHGIYLMETQGAPLLTQPAWLLAAAIGVWKGGRSGWIWAGVAVALAAVGLGARVGEAHLVNPVWTLASHLPFLSRLWFPYRVTMVVMVPMTALAVAAYQGLGRSRVAGAGFLALSLAGQAWAGVFPLNHHDATCPPLLLDAARQPGTFLFLPTGIQSDALLWQTGFQRPTFGGMGESARAFWPPHYGERLRGAWMRTLSAAVSASSRPLPEPDGSERALRDDGLRWVVLRRDLLLGLWHGEQDRGGTQPLAERDAATIRQLTAALGPPAAADGDLLLWDLDGTYANAAFPVTPQVLATPASDVERRPAFELGLERLGRAHARP